MRKWAHERGRYRNLELAYWELTFIKGGRHAKLLPKNLQSIDPNARPPSM